jgi:type IV secretory pathway TrbL component
MHVLFCVSDYGSALRAWRIVSVWRAVLMLNFFLISSAGAIDTLMSVVLVILTIVVALVLLARAVIWFRSEYHSIVR